MRQTTCLARVIISNTLLFQDSYAAKQHFSSFKVCHLTMDVVSRKEEGSVENATFDEVRASQLSQLSVQVETSSVQHGRDFSKFSIRGALLARRSRNIAGTPK